MKNLSFPLNNTNHPLYNKPFSNQCQFIEQCSCPYELFGVTLRESLDRKSVLRIYRHLITRFHSDKNNNSEESKKATARIIDAKNYILYQMGDKIDDIDKNSFLSSGDNKKIGNNSCEAGVFYKDLLDEVRKNLPVPPDKKTDITSCSFSILLSMCFYADDCCISESLIEEIKKRIQINKSLLLEKLPPTGYTITILVARLKNIDLFHWLIKQSENPKEFLQTKNDYQVSCVSGVLCNDDLESSEKMLNIVNKYLGITEIQAELKYYLETYGFIPKERLNLILKWMPPDYWVDNGLELAEKNPVLIKCTDNLFSNKGDKEEFIKKQLRTNPRVVYQCLNEKDRTRFDYIIMVLSAPENRTLPVVSKIPIKKLPVAFILALESVYPDMHNKFLKTLIFDELNFFMRIHKNTGFISNPIVLSAIFCIIVVVMGFSVYELVTDFSLIGLIMMLIFEIFTLAMETYGLYSAYKISEYCNEIKFFKDTPNLIEPNTNSEQNILEEEETLTIN